jgi:hypothetical protein
MLAAASMAVRILPTPNCPSGRDISKSPNSCYLRINRKQDINAYQLRQRNHRAVGASITDMESMKIKP